VERPGEDERVDDVKAYYESFDVKMDWFVA